MNIDEALTFHATYYPDVEWRPMVWHHEPGRWWEVWRGGVRLGLQRSEDNLVADAEKGQRIMEAGLRPLPKPLQDTLQSSMPKPALKELCWHLSIAWEREEELSARLKWLERYVDRGYASAPPLCCQKCNTPMVRQQWHWRCTIEPQKGVMGALPWKCPSCIWSHEYQLHCPSCCAPNPRETRGKVVSSSSIHCCWEELGECSHCGATYVRVQCWSD
jgi:hypothetical protein